MWDAPENLGNPALDGYVVQYRTAAFCSDPAHITQESARAGRVGPGPPLPPRGTPSRWASTTPKTNSAGSRSTTGEHRASFDELAVPTRGASRRRDRERRRVRGAGRGLPQDPVAQRAQTVRVACSPRHATTCQASAPTRHTPRRPIAPGRAGHGPPAGVPGPTHEPTADCYLVFPRDRGRSRAHRPLHRRRDGHARGADHPGRQRRCRRFRAPQPGTDPRRGPDHRGVGRPRDTPEEAPDHAGYIVQYRALGSTTWIDFRLIVYTTDNPETDETRSAVITGLGEGTYEVRVGTLLTEGTGHVLGGFTAPDEGAGRGARSATQPGADPLARGRSTVDVGRSLEPGSQPCRLRRPVQKGGQHDLDGGAHHRHRVTFSTIIDRPG